MASISSPQSLPTVPSAGALPRPSATLAAPAGTPGTDRPAQNDSAAGAMIPNGNTTTAPAGHEVHPDVPVVLLPQFARMPVAISVTVPVRDFRVRNLLAIVAGEVIESQWGQSEDLPLASGDVQLAWSEFEVIDSRLAVRVTRLA